MNSDTEFLIKQNEQEEVPLKIVTEYKIKKNELDEEYVKMIKYYKNNQISRDNGTPKTSNQEFYKEDIIRNHQGYLSKLEKLESEYINLIDNEYFNKTRDAIKERYDNRANLIKENYNHRKEIIKKTFNEKIKHVERKFYMFKSNRSDKQERVQKEYNKHLSNTVDEYRANNYNLLIEYLKECKPIKEQCEFISDISNITEDNSNIMGCELQF
jgi:hypothetical protein